MEKDLAETLEDEFSIKNNGSMSKKVYGQKSKFRNIYELIQDSEIDSQN